MRSICNSVKAYSQEEIERSQPSVISGPSKAIPFSSATSSSRGLPVVLDCSREDSNFMFKCPLLPCSFKENATWDYLQRHWRTIHRGKEFALDTLPSSCLWPDCGVRVIGKKVLEDHIKQHIDCGETERPAGWLWFCLECGQPGHAGPLLAAPIVPKHSCLTAKKCELKTVRFSVLIDGKWDDTVEVPRVAVSS